MPTSVRARAIQREAHAEIVPLFREQHPTGSDRPELTEDDIAAIRESERVKTKASLRFSKGWRERVLGVPCLDHSAARGEFCWRNPRSGVRGICMPRVVRASREDHGFQQSAQKVGTGRAR